MNKNLGGASGRSGVLMHEGRGNIVWADHLGDVAEISPTEIRLEDHDAVAIGA